MATARMATNTRRRGAPKLSLHLEEQMSSESFLALLLLYVEGKISAEELLASKAEAENTQETTKPRPHSRHSQHGHQEELYSPVTESGISTDGSDSSDDSVVGFKDSPESLVVEVGNRETFGVNRSFGAENDMSALAAVLPSYASANPHARYSQRVSSMGYGADYPDKIPDSPAFSSVESSPVTPGPHADMIVHEIEESSMASQDFDPAWWTDRKGLVSGSTKLGVIRENEHGWPTTPRSYRSTTHNANKFRYPNANLDAENGNGVRMVSSFSTSTLRNDNFIPSTAANMPPRPSEPSATWWVSGGQFPEKRTLTPHDLAVSRSGFGHARSSSLPALKVVTRAEGILKKVHSSRSLDLSGRPRAKPEPVFGVSLAESMRVAKMRVMISHKGRGDSSRSYPPSVYKCCEFIRSKGLHHRNVFANQGDGFAVAMLKDIFSTGPDFGEIFEFEGTDFTVFDAGSLIIHYLDSLPEPLVPATVAKKWVLLARQAGAIEPPAPRVEQGLDFWVEAFHALPMANCHLIKHLLNLFAYLSTVSGTLSHIEARNLASAVSRGLFQPRESPGGGKSDGSFGFKRRSSKVLDEGNLLLAPKALAYLISERAKYLDLMRITANQRDSNGFMPSSREIMRWKGPLCDTRRMSGHREKWSR